MFEVFAEVIAEAGAELDAAQIEGFVRLDDVLAAVGL
jgi:hypothetical protein